MGIDIPRWRSARVGDLMKKCLTAIAFILMTGWILAQETNPPVEPMDQTPVFRVKVVSRTTKAVNYRHRGGSTTVDFKGTSLMAEAGGRAKVDGKAGRLAISAEFTHLQPVAKFGAQYLT